jgi:hypothetical protein
LLRRSDTARRELSRGVERRVQGVIDVREDSGKAPTPMRRARGSNARELPYIRILSALRSRNT